MSELKKKKHHTNPKQTWETLNNLLQRTSSKKELPGKFISELGQEIEDDLTISELLNKYFVEIGEKLKKVIPKCFHDHLANIQEFMGDEMVLSLTNRKEV